jgi:hypothetical protein
MPRTARRDRDGPARAARKRTVRPWAALLRFPPVRPAPALLVPVLLAALLLALSVSPSQAGGGRVCPRQPAQCMTAGGDAVGTVLAKACFRADTLRCELCSPASPAGLCTQTYDACSGGACKGCMTEPMGMRPWRTYCCDAAGKCVDQAY